MVRHDCRKAIGSQDTLVERWELQWMQEACWGGCCCDRGSSGCGEGGCCYVLYEVVQPEVGESALSLLPCLYMLRPVNMPFLPGIPEAHFSCAIREPEHLLQPRSAPRQHFLCKLLLFRNKAHSRTKQG